MKEKIYLFAKENLINIIKDILTDFSVHNINLEDINSYNLKNTNIIIVSEINFTKKIKESFFLNNNVAIFSFLDNEFLRIKKLNNTNIFSAPMSIKKFHDEVKIYFFSKKINFMNTEILGEKITNTNLGLSIKLTSLENKILTLLFEEKKIKKDYILVEVLKINKNIETKTIESHLTRIRRKLFKIKSDVQITAKEDAFFLNFTSNMGQS